MTKDKGSIAIIDCSIKTQAIECFNKMSVTLNLPLTYHLPAIYGLESLHRLSKIKAMIVLGSLSNVSDKLSWQIELQDHLYKSIKIKFPPWEFVLANQLIAQSFGAIIGHIDNKDINNGSKEITIYETKMKSDLGNQISLFSSHSYELKSLPNSFELIGSSKECKHEIVKHKKLPYLGIQSHPESSLGFINRLSRSPLTNEEIDSFIKNGEKVINHFISDYT